jgi:hypothetical protein
MELKKLAQELFDKNVLLCIKTNSPSFIKYGKQLRGKLTGHDWGKILTSNHLSFETITALKILSNSLEKTIPANDIDFITEDNFR